MKEACRDLTRATVAKPFLQLPAQAPLPELIQIAEIFVELQEARHSADYDVGASFSRTEALEHITNVELAFRSWQSVRASQQADMFRVALAFGRRLNR